jgi:CDP-archaeol synthase
MPCLREFPVALLFAVPFTAAGLIHLFVIVNKLFPRLAAIQLDFGCKIRGTDVFGANKTLRGLIVMVVGVTACFSLLSLFPAAVPYLNDSPFSPPQPLPPLIWFSLLGFGCILGELPNSFAKRRLQIPPGAEAHRTLRPAFWLLDQADSLIGVVVILALSSSLSACLLFWLLALTLTLHPLGTAALSKLRGTST